MTTFNLSLAVKPTDSSEVKASKDHEVVKDEKGQEHKQTTTAGGLDIDKSKSPVLKIDGPLGHMYTELLNKQLSLESMGAVIAAVDNIDQIDAQTQEIMADTGKVSISNNQASIDQPHGELGYIYVLNADTLESKELYEVSKKLIDRRLNSTTTPIGLIAISEGSPSETLETLVNIIKPLDATICLTYESGKNYIKNLLTDI